MKTVSEQMDGRAARRLERRVFRFIAEQDLVVADEPMLLAVSGGPDSLALLHMLARGREPLDLRPVVAYIDHRVRPSEVILAERAYVAAAAERLGLPFVWDAVDPGGRRRSPEEAARWGRYAVLARLAASVGARRVATGHTRSDQAETVLLRLLRGSGVRGLSGMAPDSAWPLPLATAPRLIRPLLVLSREETSAYCRALALSPRQDAENENRRYLRNRVRAEVMPALRALNPRIEQTLADLAEESRLLSDLVDAHALKGDEVAPATEATTGALPLGPLQSAGPLQRRAVLRGMLRTTFPDRPAPSRAHLLALERLALAANGRIDLPDGMRAWCADGMLRIGRPESPAPRTIGPDQPVPVPGDIDVAGWRVCTRITRTRATVEAEEGWRVALDAGAVRGLTVGRRRSGDRIELAGIAGRKRVQDLFVDAKVPRDERDRRPVFRSERGVVWVAGFRPACWAAARDGLSVVVDVSDARGR